MGRCSNFHWSIVVKELGTTIWSNTCFDSNNTCFDTFFDSCAFVLHDLIADLLFLTGWRGAPFIKSSKCFLFAIHAVQNFSAPGIRMGAGVSCYCFLEWSFVLTCFFKEIWWSSLSRLSLVEMHKGCPHQCPFPPSAVK